MCCWPSPQIRTDTVSRYAGSETYRANYAAARVATRIANRVTQRPAARTRPFVTDERNTGNQSRTRTGSAPPLVAVW